MYDAGTIAHGNVTVAGHEMCLLILLLCSLSRTGKEGFIFLIFQILADVSLKNLISLLVLGRKLSKNSVKKCLCHIISSAVSSLYLAISLVWVYAESQVRGQGPGRGRPRQEISIL